MKKLFKLFLLVFLIIANTFSVFSYSEDEHSKILIEVLFGNNPTVSNTDAIDAINYAVAISIDHYNSDYSSSLVKLKNDYKIKGLPSSLKSINYKANSLTHRLFTHKGWDHNYLKDESLKDKTEIVKNANFQKRKDILLKTVNQVFDFGFWSGKLWFPYDEQCNSFAAYIYYVHILGDYIHDGESEASFHDYGMIPLVDSDGIEGMIDEIEKHSKILFSKQENGDGLQKRNYNEFLDELDRIRSDINRVFYSKQDLYNSETYKQYANYASELMECLKAYTPILIKEEDFFKKVFK